MSAGHNDKPIADLNENKVCYYCKIGLSDDEYFTVDDQETMCEDCMELHYYWCYEKGDMVKKVVEEEDYTMELIKNMSRYYEVEINDDLLQMILDKSKHLDGCWFADWLSHTLYAINLSKDDNRIEYKHFEDFEI